MTRVSLRQTLSELVDLGALGDRNALPGLLVSATDVAEGQIKYFYSREESLSLDHIIASGSLPPSFPMTSVDGKSYWDGGVFDNTPLGAVLDRLDQTAGVDRTVYVVNLFPNKAPIPGSLIEVAQRVQSLQFANKTAESTEVDVPVRSSRRAHERARSVTGRQPTERQRRLQTSETAKLHRRTENRLDHASKPRRHTGWQRLFAGDDQQARERKGISKPPRHCSKTTMRGAFACRQAMRRCDLDRPVPSPRAIKRQLVARRGTARQVRTPECRQRRQCLASISSGHTKKASFEGGIPSAAPLRSGQRNQCLG